MHIETCGEAYFSSNDDRYCSRSYAQVFFEVKNNDTYEIRVEDCCYCELKALLDDFKFESGEFEFRDYTLVHNRKRVIEFEEGSTMGFIKHNYDIMSWSYRRMAKSPQSLKGVLDVNRVKVNFEYHRYSRLAEFLVNDLETSKLLLSKMTFKKIDMVEDPEADGHSFIDGSPMVLQFRSDSSNQRMDAFIKKLETSIINSDAEALRALQSSYDDVLVVGEQDFYDEIATELDKAKEKDLGSFKVSDGYCHGCLENKPVKMFSNGDERFGLYYHMEPGEPVEIHTCSYCFKEKLTINNPLLDRLMANESRDPWYLKTTKMLANFIREGNIDELYSLIDSDDFTYNLDGEESEDGYGFIFFSEKIKEVNSLGSLGELKYLFLSYNEDTWMSDPESYNGVPGFYCDFYDRQIMTLWSGDKENGTINYINEIIIDDKFIFRHSEITFTDIPIV